jgi:hypothetical protein
MGNFVPKADIANLPVYEVLGAGHRTIYFKLLNILVIGC